jgi:hypothetical protein
MNRLFHGSERAAVVDGAQRLQLAGGGHGDQAVFARGFGGIEQGAQESGSEPGHVAGDEKVPIRGGDAQSRAQAAHGTHAFNDIPLDGEAQKLIAFGRADQGHVAGCLADASGDLLNQSDRTGGKQGLVAAHAGAAPARQHEPGSSHETMVASGPGGQGVAPVNKTVYICFILVLLMLATSPLRAADADAGAVVSKTFVVRVDPRTHKLVRQEVVAHAPVAPARISELVDKTARAHDVDPLLVHSIIQVESNYNPNAVSPKGAEGLMQLMPPTARMLGVGNSFDPGENIEAGVRYLKQLQELYKDDRLALAAYNAGPGAVEKFKRTVPPYPETQKYVESVGKRYGDAKASEKKEAVTHTAPGPEISAPPTEEQYSNLEQFVDENGRLHLRTAPAQ